MKEISLYTSSTGLETLKILKKGKDITKYFDVVEMNGKCSIFIGEKTPSRILGIDFGFKGKRYNMKRLLRNSVYIHSHPVESPLSYIDVISAVEMKVKKMIAVTPSLKYTSMEFDSKSRKVAKENFSLFNPLKKGFRRKKKSKGQNLMDDKMAYKNYMNLCLNKLIEFSEKCGLKFESTL